MTYRTREDARQQLSEGHWIDNIWVPPMFKDKDEDVAIFLSTPKPRLDWLLLLALTLDLGVWVGLLAWWIWR